jgi:hypothetical protein
MRNMEVVNLTVFNTVVLWAHSCNCCCRVKAICVYIFRVCVCVCVCVCVYSLSCPACYAHAHHLWSARLYNIFQHYLINDTIFEKKKKCYWTWNMDFSTNFIWNFFYYKKNWVRYDQKICIVLYVGGSRYLLSRTILNFINCQLR